MEAVQGWKDMPETIARDVGRLLSSSILVGLLGCHEGATMEAQEETASEMAQQVAQVAPPDHPAWLPGSRVLVAGYGCPPNVTTMLPFREGFDLVPPASSELISNGSSEQRRTCMVAAELPATAGWQYAIRRVRVAGKQTLPTGATIESVINVPGAIPASARTISKGDASGTTTVFGANAQGIGSWSPCGAKSARVVTFNFSLKSSEPASLKLDRYMIDLTWRRCT